MRWQTYLAVVVSLACATCFGLSYLFHYSDELPAIALTYVGFFGQLVAFGIYKLERPGQDRTTE